MTPPARTLIAAAAARFPPATPRLDAELLLAHVLGIERSALLLDLDRCISPETLAIFTGLADRRAEHEPIAYLTGTRGFWTVELAVAPGVLIPRADSETLIEAAAAHFAGKPGPGRVLDLGTGSGALLLAALDQWPNATGVGLDASPDALRIARENAERLRLADRAVIAQGGWEGTGEAFDLILCNPPYIAIGADLPREVRDYEPAAALFAGPDGLDDYRRIAPVLRPQLAPGGAACIEIGHDQGETAAALFRQQDFVVSTRRDLGGNVRVLVVS